MHACVSGVYMYGICAIKRSKTAAYTKAHCFWKRWSTKSIPQVLDVSAGVQLRVVICFCRCSASAYSMLLLHADLDVDMSFCVTAIALCRVPSLRASKKTWLSHTSPTASIGVSRVLRRVQHSILLFSAAHKPRLWTASGASRARDNT